ncbi:MAG: hypothetical protein ACE5F1_22165 [Planctomycetota bacterium]
MTPIAPPYYYFGHEGLAGERRSHTIVTDDFEAAVLRAKQDKKVLLINFTGFQ